MISTIESKLISSIVYCPAKVNSHDDERDLK